MKHQAFRVKRLHHRESEKKFPSHLVLTNDNSRKSRICSFSVDGGQPICLSKESCFNEQV